MKKRVLVVAPHADDEILGCGGALLRHLDRGDEAHWVLVTDMSTEAGFTKAQVETRAAEIEKIRQQVGFSGVHRLGFKPGGLDAVPLQLLIQKMTAVFKSVEPELVYLPFSGDAHSDHAYSFKAGAACAKWFRFPSVKQVLAYETISETHFSFDPTQIGFQPNTYVDISAYLDRKIDLARIYTGEIKAHPFPRSPEALRALATMHGSVAGSTAAEAFVLLKQIL